MDFGIGHRLQPPLADLRQPVLPELDVVIEAGDPLEHFEVVRQALAGLLHEPQVVVLGVADPLGFLADAEPFEPVEHRPVIDAGARGIVDPRLRLDQAHLDPGLRQAERGHEPGRATADDDHVMHCAGHHGAIN